MQREEALKAVDEIDRYFPHADFLGPPREALATIRAALLEPAPPEVREAIKYTLMRIQTDPNVGYYCGVGTQVFYLLCKAEAVLDGRELAQVETDRRVNLIPAHRQQKPDVELLREDLEELRR